ncbi:MAG: Protein translocase subunit SecE [Chlamydiae bacterium]|nr:Protein translocase subunit SecE [Chlamydiota bacterium]
MEKINAKKNHPNASVKGMEGKKLIAFVGDVKQELKKVDWTDKEELIVCTKIVLASTFLFGLFVYINDLVVQGFLNTIHFLVKVVFG